MGEGTATSPSSSSTLPSLAKLRQLVTGPLRDTNSEFFEDWFVNDMLNEAYVDLNARLRLNKKEASGSTTSAGKITIPSDLVEVENLFISSVPASFVDDDTFRSFEMAAVSPYGLNDEIAQLVRVNVAASVFETFPAANTLAYELEYVGRPTLMSLDTDTPSVLTRELIPRIVNYARAHCYWSDGRESEGARAMALYEQGLPGAPREAFRRRPFPMSLIPESGPFG